MWGSLGSVLGGSGARARGTLILRECDVLPAFDGTGILDSPPRQVIYTPGSRVSSWVTTLRFLAGNRGTELKPTTFSSLLLFHVFLSFLFS